MIIISVENDHYKNFWEEKFSGRKDIAVITEDWPGGAGNWLGTLYAYKKAGYVLDTETSVAIYHTAGKGKRLYPLTPSEGGNKSAIILPGGLTILEAVIKQTEPYRYPGRLSVFWGDQIFIPSAPPSIPQSHIAILTRDIPIPTQEDWEAKKYHQYGLVIKNCDGHAMQLEKISYANLSHVLQKYPNDDIGLSLGSFSLSKEILEAALAEYEPELNAKTTKMDSDPDFIMPATLDQTSYLLIKNEVEYYNRVQSFKLNFDTKCYFGSIDIGKDSLWWDYGTVRNYYTNMMKIVEESQEGESMRAFFDIQLTNGSYIADSDISSSKIQKCVCINVQANQLNIENCLLVNTQSNGIVGKENLFYNMSGDAIQLKPGEVRADIAGTPYFTHLDRDGKEDWDVKLPKNEKCYGDIVFT